MKVELNITLEGNDYESIKAAVAGLGGVVQAAFNELGVVGTMKQLEPGLTKVYTDGGCDSKKNIGSWAFRVEGEEISEHFGAFIGTTNNRMEMMAIIRALEYVEIGPPVQIISDSEYVINGATKWAKGWEKRGWITYGGKPVKNQDLWKRLIGLVSLHSVTFKHVPGHSGNAGNERVDELCTMAMVNALAGQIPDVPVDQKDAA